MIIQLSGSRNIRRQVLLLTASLNRWCQVRQDLLFAFEHSLNADLDDNLRKAIRDMLSRVKSGMPADDALVMLGDYSDNEYFQDLLTAIRANIRHRGNLHQLLDSMEWQLYKLEESFSNRRISNSSEIRTSLIYIGLTGLFAAGKLLTRYQTISRFFSDPAGLSIFAVSLFMYTTAVILLVHTIIKLNI